MKKSAFTLIELLVVIAIIAILAGIALPVFQKAQERGRAINDASNLRELGKATVAYLNDNDEQMFAIPGAGGGAVVSWPITLHDKYVTTWKVFHSPFDKRAIVETTPAPVSYAVNTNTMAIKDPYKGNAAQFVSPSELVLMAADPDKSDVLKFESPQLTWNGNPVLVTPGANKKYGTHSNRNQINVLFADAHVSSLAWGEYTDSTSPEGIRRWQPLGL